MRYVVPQFIDVEDKIIGPITTRQFLILLATSFIGFITYKLVDFTLFLVLGIMELIIGGVLAFFRVNGQPFHFFMLNVVQTLRRPQLRLWDKQYLDGELREIMKAPPPPPPPKRIRKESLAGAKLGELSLIVNTGGVYNPEE
ncbi:MAG: PrgI family protein [Patescibacteria group bacterium]|nr:PrgI family protein [Patescibacteria group bacterium]